MKKIDSKHINKIQSNAFLLPLIVCLTVTLLAACGQRGSLYLPTAPEAAQRSSIVETLGAPTTTDTDKNSNSSTAPKTPPASK